MEEELKHFVWGENNISQEQQQTYIIKLDHPACAIRFNYLDSFVDYNDFFENIADIQFYTGDRPDREEVNKILANAWNFMVLEERRLDEDLS